jgi:hypothetical protein
MIANGKFYIIKSVTAPTQTSGGIFIKGNDETQIAQIHSVGADMEKPLPIGTKIVVDWARAMPIKYLSDTYYACISDAVVATL